MKPLLIAIALVLAVGAGYYLAKTSELLETSKAAPAVNEEANAPAGKQAPGMKAALVGYWQSVQDPKSARQFNADATFSDFYAGDPAGAPGTWEIATDGSEELRLHSEGDVLRFRVVAVTPERLELIYLDRGGVLVYAKVAR